MSKEEKSLKERIFQLFSNIIDRIRSIGTTRSPIDKEIVQGKALQVYWFLVTHDTASIREIQRALDFASPGTVTYQLSKLESAGVVVKDPEQDKYRVRAEIKSGILGFYIRIGYRMIPRFSIYLLLFLLGLFCFILTALDRGDAFITDPFNWIILLILFLGIFAFIFESIRIWRMRPQ
ncbi:MAG: hypothetical protein EAX86_12645 [Candidatus Heimdallarchaeota archaeon]|nr:hypothetical protein [Candidatus Heimdallarchaeota archaeon]